MIKLQHCFIDGDFADWVDFAYWESFIGEGLPTHSLGSRLVYRNMELMLLLLCMANCRFEFKAPVIFLFQYDLMLCFKINQFINFRAGENML